MWLLVKNLRLLMVAVAAVLLTVATAPAGAKTPGEVPIAAALRDAQLDALIGPNRKLSDFRRKPLLINVWASWCGPCRDEMGSLERLARRYGGKQFHVIGISTDDYRDRANGFLKAYRITFPNFIDHDLLLENMLGADHLPLTLLVDAQGKVLGKYYGSREWDSPGAAKLISTTFRLPLQ